MSNSHIPAYMTTGTYIAIELKKKKRIGQVCWIAVFCDQCKEIEENKIMGKTRDLFKTIGNTNRTFHAKMGTIKDRNGRDLTEAEDFNKRWQEYTEEA